MFHFDSFLSRARIREKYRLLLFVPQRINLFIVFIGFSHFLNCYILIGFFITFSNRKRFRYSVDLIVTFLRNVNNE